jgi:hypothetical protein
VSVPHPHHRPWAPASTSIRDSCRPARFTVAAPLLKRTLFVARSDVARRCPRLVDLTAVDLTRHRGVARLLVSYLDAGSERRPRSVRAGLYAVAVEHIERRLGDPDLTPERIASGLATSLRTLQLAFAEHEDSVAAHIRRRRLSPAHIPSQHPTTRGQPCPSST